jgi:hypothetical protein
MQLLAAAGGGGGDACYWWRTASNRELLFVVNWQNEQMVLPFNEKMFFFFFSCLTWLRQPMRNQPPFWTFWSLQKTFCLLKGWPLTTFLFGSEVFFFFSRILFSTRSLQHHRNCPPPILISTFPQSNMGHFIRENEMNM